ncbi:hypothetical protein SMJ63A_80024 [Stenotrophomonas geniculata]
MWKSKRRGFPLACKAVVQPLRRAGIPSEVDATGCRQGLDDEPPISLNGGKQSNGWLHSGLPRSTEEPL